MIQDYLAGSDRSELAMQTERLAASAQGIWWTALMSVVYGIITLSGMLIWVTIAFRGLNKFNWHKLEHKAGIIAGSTLIATGILTYLIH